MVAPQDETHTYSDTADTDSAAGEGEGVMTIDPKLFRLVAALRVLVQARRLHWSLCLPAAAQGRGST
jgi:hypothetical protein